VTSEIAYPWMSFSITLRVGETTAENLAHESTFQNER
jgi:hypothetical protein